MAITFECEECGKSFTVRDEFAGKGGKCKYCGHRMTIPSTSDAAGYPVDLLDGADEGPAVVAPLPPRAAMAPAPIPSKPAKKKKKKKSGRSFFSFSGSGSGDQGGRSREVFGGVGGFLFLLWFAFRVYVRWHRIQGGVDDDTTPQSPDPTVRAAAAAAAPATTLPPVRADAIPTGPIPLPNFPDPGPGSELELGVTFHQIILGPERPPVGSTPGHGGKLWLYLPSGDHKPGSLPCILITGAGSNLLSGMDLNDADRAEHMPYVRAGFAVLAFELDGVPINRKRPTAQDESDSMTRFLAARAGLVNAHVALEYVLAKVPQVDPRRISVAGHSSAGTLALLFAENEPRLRSCVAFAPAIDIEKYYRRDLADFKKAGAIDLVVRYSPANGAQTLDCPLYLFGARDDFNPLTMAVDAEAFANRLRALGKDVTLKIVPTGGHYESMIDEGIPGAISWLLDRDGPGR